MAQTLPRVRTRLEMPLLLLCGMGVLRILHDGGHDRVHVRDDRCTRWPQWLLWQWCSDGSGRILWVRVRPRGTATNPGPCLLLARAGTPAQQKRIGDQTGGRVFLFLETDDCRRDYDRWRAQGVRFLETPREESYGTVVVFQDLYGNRWDLIQRRDATRS